MKYFFQDFIPKEQTVLCGSILIQFLLSTLYTTLHNIITVFRFFSYTQLNIFLKSVEAASRIKKRVYIYVYNNGIWSCETKSEFSGARRSTWPRLTSWWRSTRASATSTSPRSSRPWRRRLGRVVFFPPPPRLSRGTDGWRQKGRHCPKVR